MAGLSHIRRGGNGPRRLVVCAAALLVFAVPGVAGAVAPPLRDGLTPHALLTPDGLLRTFWLYQPPGLDARRPVPLVVVLHGGGGDGLMYRDWTRFDALARKQRFVVAYPDGWLRAWNARTCCFLAWRARVDDVGFLDALVDRVASRRSIDRRRVYAAGHSNGAMLADLLACDSRRFAAVAAVSGALGPPCAARAPVSVLHIHGTADANAPYEGGNGSDSLTATEHHPVRATIADWRERNACPASAVSTRGAVTTEMSEGCRAGTAVGLHTIAGGTHPWPGSSATTINGAAPSQALDATRAVWDFFAAHPRAGFASSLLLPVRRCCRIRSLMVTDEAADP